MGAVKRIKADSHVVDILGQVAGRDQPIMVMNMALRLASCLDEKLFMDEDTVFFDPFSKAGELLLACAFRKCFLEGSSKNMLFDVSKIQKELYQSNRYFALAPDERHHRLSLRTFLGNANSHNPKYSHIIKDGHYLNETDGRLDKQKFKEELNRMIEYIRETTGKKKVVAIGNPPYQESDGGFGGSAKAIYNHFTEMLMDTPDIAEFILVIPSRWFAVGKGVDTFRHRIKESKSIKAIHYFRRSKEIFKTVDVLGGVCFVHFDRDFKGTTSFIEDETVTKVNLNEFDIIPDDPKAYTIIRKIKARHDKFLNEVAWSRNPYGFSTTFFRDNKECSAKDKGAIKCLTRGRKFKYTKKSYISKNTGKVNFFKVVIPAAFAPGGPKQGVRRVTLPKKHFFILEKDEITSETYTVLDTFSSRKDAERFVKFLQTDFARYLLGLRKITQHIPKDRWAWVPYMDPKQEWTDEKLFSYFNLSKPEIENIKRKVSEWV